MGQLSLLNRTPLSVHTFIAKNKKRAIKVVYQCTDGTIGVSLHVQGVQDWSTDIIGKGKISTGLAAASWNGGSEVSRYYLYAPFNFHNEIRG
jgi:hypothetical protein